MTTASSDIGAVATFGNYITCWNGDHLLMGPPVVETNFLFSESGPYIVGTERGDVQARGTETF